MRGTADESSLAPARECVLSAPITVLASPNPFERAKRIEIDVGADLTIEEIVERCGFDLSKPYDLIAKIEGHRIPRAMWRHTRPNPGTTVTIHAVPRGARGKAIGTLIAGLLIMIVGAALWWTGATVPAALAGLNLTWGSIAVLGGLYAVAGAISLAAPPPAVPFAGEIPTSDSRAIAAAQNEIRPFAPVPRVFGRYRVFPQYAAKPFTETVGSDQYLRLLFTFGYGPLQITEIRIGEDLVESFQDVEHVLHPGFDDDEPLSLFTSGVDELDMQVGLTAGVAAFTVRTTEPSTTEGSLDLVFPGGLLAFDEDDGAPKSIKAQFTIEYRPAGSSGAWTGVTATTPLGPGMANPTAGSFSIDGRARGLLARGIRWVFPSSGQWEVRVRRDSNVYDFGDVGDIIDECNWTKLRSIRPGTAPKVPNLALLELRIRATDQLSGVIQTLSAMVEAILPVWNEIDGWGPPNRHSTNPSLQATRNPAWAMAEMLRGGVNARPIADESIDALSLAEWAVASAEAERWFDAVVDMDTTIGQICRDIAGSARASFDLRDGRYGVVVDEPRSTIVTQFSARDTSGFEGQKTFAREVHGLRVRFISPAAGYEPDERIVYADGFDESNALEMVDLDLWGVTDADRAYRDGRYHLAAGKLRPEVYSFTIDVAHLAIQRGDRVRYSHDVMMVGLGSARITHRYESAGMLTGFDVDQIIEYDPEIAYAARARVGTTGETVLYLIRNWAQDVPHVLFVTPVDAAGGPQVGDLIAWGEAGKETGDYLVSSITPGPDLTARVELVDYSEAIYSAADGPVPPFDPNITDPRPTITQVPQRPQIVGIASDESVLLIDSDGTARPRILVSVQVVASDRVPPAFLQVQWRTSSPVGDWFSAPAVDVQTAQVSVYDVETGLAYDVRVRAVTGPPIPGRASEWATVLGHVVVGASTRPPDVQNTRVDPGDLLAWDYPNPPRDLAGFIVRHQAGSDATWETGIPAHAGVVTVSSFSIAALPPGERTVMVKAIDSSRNESLNAGIVVISIGGLLIENVVEEKDFHADGFAGTKVGSAVEGGSGDLVADLVVSAFWDGRAPGGRFWGADADEFWGSSYQALAYEDEWEPPSIALPGRLFLDLAVSGSLWSIFYRESGGTSWIQWPGYVDAIDGVTYQFRLEIAGGPTRGRVTAFAAQIDKPDLEQRIDDFVVASTGTIRLPITSGYFAAIKQVLLTVQDDGNGGRTAIVFDKNATLGPSIQVFNAAGTRVAGKVDARVRGY